MADHFLEFTRVKAGMPYRVQREILFGSMFPRDRHSSAEYCCKRTLEVLHLWRNRVPALVNATAKNFTVSEVSGDKAYLSLENFQAVANVGGTGFITFQANSTGGVGGAFKKVFHYFQFAKETYLAKYHKRSNVESTFSMVKRKFGHGVRAKNELAQRNEVYSKFVCHNICVLSSEMYTLGITAMFEKTGCRETAIGMPACTLTSTFAGA